MSVNGNASKIVVNHQNIDIQVEGGGGDLTANNFANTTDGFVAKNNNGDVIFTHDDAQKPYQRIYFADGAFAGKNIGDKFTMTIQSFTGSEDGGNASEWFHQFDNGEGEKAYILDKTNNVLGIARDTENATMFNVFIIKTNVGSSSNDFDKFIG
jgi:hypothetical protein